MEKSNFVRYKATIAYDGTHFSGFQIQPDERTVQGELEQALKTINKDTFVRLHPAGRTDAGVHAQAMVFHFDFPNTIPKEGLFKALNVLTPSDISLNHLERVTNDFHARYHALSKTYTYRVDNKTVRNPFTRNYMAHHPYEMDEESAQEALDVLVGTHDFTSFCSTKTDKKDKVRTVFEANVKVNNTTKEWLFTFSGDGFLYNMIRIIMGTVLAIADGRLEVSKMREILKAKDRSAAGQTIAPNGLRLEKVTYNMENFLEK
jgi:tRNA pseudouridine38-40 synthase